MKIGKISESILKRSVLKQIKTKNKAIFNGAGVGEDCAIFAPSDGRVMVSSVAEAAVRTGADIERAVCKCANNIGTAGAVPVAAMISITLPESTEEEKLKEFMAAAEAACGARNMQIAGGHTSISPAVVCPLAVITGYGIADPEKVRTTKGARPGQDIVVSKWIGLEGTALLAEAFREELSERYPLYLVEEALGFQKLLSILPEAEAAVQAGAGVMHDCSEGGIFAGLWELAESSGTGLVVDLKKLPIRQETVEVCEVCNVNPYELLSGGAMIMTADDGLYLVNELQGKGIPAVIVGKITDNNDRIVINEEERRFLDRPRTDEIYKRLSLL